MLDPSLHLNYREMAVANITDGNLLEKLLTDKKETIVKAAVLKITDEETLIKTAERLTHTFFNERTDPR